MTVNAHAKVNFTLEVLGKRNDGYHDLRSIVVPISLHDTLHIEESETTALKISDPENFFNGCEAPGENNLVMKAVRLMQRITGRRDGVTIELEKHIPCGGGLGGGSADAAAVFNALNGMWNLNIDPIELAGISAEIGSDIPALVLGGAVLMEGRGEKVARIPIESKKQFSLVLHNPGIFCSTPEIFSLVKGRITGDQIFYAMLDAMVSGDPARVSMCLNNDLAVAAYERYPEIALAAAKLENAGASGVSMSGSGSTVFAVAADDGHAFSIASKIDAYGWTKAVKTLI